MVNFRVLGWLILFQIFGSGLCQDGPRPVWNIAHMVNAIYQVDRYLDRGANAIEFDITFNSSGNVLYTFHGVPCDCFRDCLKYEKIEDFLNYVRQLTTPGYRKFREKLVLLVFDLKIKKLSPFAKLRAGESVAKKLLNNYWRNGASSARAYVLLSMPFAEHTEFVRGFRRTLKESNFERYEKKVGYDFYGYDNFNEINWVLNYEGITDRIWQGDGITNCLPRGTSVLEAAIAKRDQPYRSYIKKVYFWTIDKKSSMRTVLRLDVDAVMTNRPENFVYVLQEKEFSGKFYLATIEDNPWETHSRDFYFHLFNH